jgi:hypothetical protein
VYADLLFQISVDLLGPGRQVGRLAAAHLIPGDRGDLAIITAALVGVVAAAAATGQQGQGHDAGEEQSKKFLHFQCFLLVVL